MRKAIESSERGQLTRAFQGKDQSGVEQLAKYKPELARRINTVRGYQAEAKALPAKPGKLTSLPRLSPKPPAPAAPAPVEAKLPAPPERVAPPDRPQYADKKTIGPEEVKEAKSASMEKRANMIEHRGTWVAAWPLFHVMSSIMRGEIPSVGGIAMESAGTYGAVRTVAGVLRNPKVVEFLTKATPKDVEQIPPDLRGQFPSIVRAAQKQGIKVSPALIASTLGAGQPPKKGVARALEIGGSEGNWNPPR